MIQTYFPPKFANTEGHFTFSTRCYLSITVSKILIESLKYGAVCAHRRSVFVCAASTASLLLTAQVIIIDVIRKGLDGRFA